MFVHGRDEFGIARSFGGAIKSAAIKVCNSVPQCFLDGSCDIIFG